MTSNGVHSFEQASAALGVQLAALHDTPDARRGPRRIHRVEVPCPDADLFAWLRAQSAGPKWYWSGRNTGIALAGAGSAWRGTSADSGGLETAVNEVRELLAQSDPEVRALGGMRFDPHRPADAEWGAFGAHRFDVPRMEIRREADRCVIACNVLLPIENDAEATLARVLEDVVFPSGNNAEPAPFDVDITDRRDRPDHAEWTTAVASCLEAFAREDVEKVVLARRTDFELDRRADGVALLRALESATPNSYHFYVEPRDGVAFLGASPERLFRRDGSQAVSEAVAGTRPRGASAVEDEALGRELLESDKDRREHDYVTRSIRKTFMEQCASVSEGEVELLRLPHCQHLITRLEGRLHPDSGEVDLLNRLHPTPAVGGVPRSAALERIRELEPFDRGWYTGPIGWMSRDASEFAVAIRSALVHANRISVYTGAGIVPGSVADEEWGELESKLADYRSVLGSIEAAASVER